MESNESTGYRAGTCLAALRVLHPFPFPVDERDDFAGKVSGQAEGDSLAFGSVGTASTACLAYAKDCDGLGCSR